MIDGQLIARKTSDNPPIYRVTFDDGTGAVEVNSISECIRHTQLSSPVTIAGVVGTTTAREVAIDLRAHEERFCSA